MRKLLLTIMLVMMAAIGAVAQRATDKVDRGLTVAACRTGGNLVSWKLFASEYYDVNFNLYRDGQKIAINLTVPTYVDASGTASHKYQVAPVINGVEGEKSAVATKWTQTEGGYSVKRVPIPDILGRDGQAYNSLYGINDMCLADVDGDGVVEFITKIVSNNSHDTSNSITFNHIECYNLKGERLWWIDLGPNMMSGPDEQFDAVAYDWDGDGKAEVIMRGADNMIIHRSDGTTKVVGNANTDTRWNGIEYTSTGNEYLLYLNGETAQEYQIMTYPLPRGNDTDWGTGIVGHRSTKHYFGAPFLDGKHASIFLGRGCYTKHHFKAFDVDPQTHALTMLWEWSNNNGWSDPWFGNGYHNFGIADVDEDGRDEIVFGSMVIDDNGKGLHTTGLGHGDSQHCGDFDPYRKGLEFFACNEDEPNMNYRNATTGELYYRSVGTNDDGRALCANFSNKFPGCLGRSVSTGLISTVADKEVSGGPATGGSNDALFWSHLNFRIYWDDDLLDEILDSPGTAKSAAIYDPDNGRLMTGPGHMNNDSKNNPSATGDIFGDWREEIVVPEGGERAFLIITTNYPNKYRIPTLWHDHQYRQAMVWQCVGYNQPPHTSFFLGELEGITKTPPPYTNDGRELIPNGGTISGQYDGKQLLVYETNDSRVSIESGAAPSVVIFNVPSWVQGTNSSNTKKAVVNTIYYTCVVSGGELAGNCQVVKQGDGTLVLPNVTMTYSRNTDVWAGTLEFDGEMQKSKLWLNRFTALNSNGGRFQDIDMEYGATMRPGGEGKMGTITAANINLGFGSVIEFDINSINPEAGEQQVQYADRVNASSISIETKNWEYGPKYLQPVFRFVTDSQDKKLEPGRYIIATADKISGDLDEIVIEGLSISQKHTLVAEDGFIYLEIEGLRDATDLVWNGAAGKTWDLANVQNFSLYEDPTSTNNMFVTGDNVFFTDEGAQLSVELKGNMEAGTINVNSSKNYVFTGSGSLVGNTSLVKDGTGTLTINNDNTYTGGTRISGGTLKVNSLSHETQAYGNLGAVNAAASKFIIENGATLQTTAAVTMGSPIRVQTSDGGVINNTAGFVMNSPISGTLLTKRGGGYMTLHGNNSLTRMIIAAGTVDTRAGQAAATVEFQGGTLVDNASNTSHAIYVPKGKSGTWTLSSTYYLAYANRITGEGTLTINPTNTVSRVRITGDWSKFTGTIKHTNTNIWLPLDASTGLPNGTLDIASGCTVTNVCQSFTIGKLTGNGALAHPIANFRNKDAVTGNNTWRVGNSSDDLGNFTFAGKITDGGGTNKANFVKIGTCKMTVSGAWDNTGTVTVQAGQLQLNSKAVLGTGTLTVNSGALLSGMANLTNSRYTINGTVNPGLNSNSPTGVISFGGNDMTVGTNGEIMVCARKCATETTDGCSSLQNIGKMTMNGMVTVNIYANNELQEGDSIRIWTANTTSGTPHLNPLTKVVDAEKGLYWDDSRLSEGLLFVTTEAPVGIQTLKDNSYVQAQVFSINGAFVANVEGSYDQIEEAVRRSNPTPGIYVIRITDGKATETRKILIK